MTKHLGKNICTYHCETRSHLAATIAAGVFPVNELGSHSLAPELRCTLSTWRCLTSFMEIFYSSFPNFTAVACLEIAAQSLQRARWHTCRGGRVELKDIEVHNCSKKFYLSIYLREL